jgi:hypothetical protein
MGTSDRAADADRGDAGRSVLADARVPEGAPTYLSLTLLRVLGGK